MKHRHTCHRPGFCREEHEPIKRAKIILRIDKTLIDAGKSSGMNLSDFFETRLRAQLEWMEVKQGK